MPRNAKASQPTAPPAEPTPRPARRKRGRPSGGLAKRPTRSGTAALTRQFFGDVSREVWDRVLSSYPEASPARKLYLLLHDPGWSNADGTLKCGIERLCGEAGMDFGDLVRAFTQHHFGEAVVEASKHSTAVLASVVQDALPSDSVCRTCVGFREVKVAHPVTGDEVVIPCFDCGGVGTQRKPGDPRKLEALLGVIDSTINPNEGGPLVVNNTQVVIGAAHGVSVQRGQELLAAGRRMREHASRGGAPVQRPSEATVDVHVEPGVGERER